MTSAEHTAVAITDAFQTPAPKPGPYLLALAKLLQDYMPALQAGAQELCKDKSAHETFLLMAQIQQARDIANLQLNGQSVARAYTFAACLTHVVECSLKKAHIQEFLASQGYALPMREWRKVFQDYGMIAIHLNTGAPTWSYGTEC